MKYNFFSLVTLRVVPLSLSPFRETLNKLGGKSGHVNSWGQDARVLFASKSSSGHFFFFSFSRGFLSRYARRPNKRKRGYS